MAPFHRLIGRKALPALPQGIYWLANLAGGMGYDSNDPGLRSPLPVTEKPGLARAGAKHPCLQPLGWLWPGKSRRCRGWRSPWWQGRRLLPFGQLSGRNRTAEVSPGSGLGDPSERQEEQYGVATSNRLCAARASKSDAQCWWLTETRARQREHAPWGGGPPGGQSSESQSLLYPPPRFPTRSLARPANPGPRPSARRHPGQGSAAVLGSGRFEVLVPPRHLRPRSPPVESARRAPHTGAASVGCQIRAGFRPGVPRLGEDRRARPRAMPCSGACCGR